MMNDVMYSHSSDDWATPKFIYDFFMNRGCIDPCPLHCEYDALAREWSYGITYFINPPYSRIKDFVDKFGGDIARSVWWLVPARTDTRWFKKLFDYASCVVFIKGRLRFNDGARYAPFPSALIHCLYNDKPTHVEIVERDRLVTHLDWLCKYY